MPITINGTTVTTNSINGTSTSSETVNGTQVYGGTGSRVWYYYMDESSEPSMYTPYKKTLEQGVSPTRATLEASMTSSFPPANILVGSTGWIWYSSYDRYYVLMVIEE